MAIAIKDYYKVLGLTPSASADDIRAAYRRLARQFHPDLHPGAEDRFKDIQEAYDILGQAGRRRRYDYLARFERHSGFDGPPDGHEDSDDEEGEEWSELTRDRFSEFCQQFFRADAEPEESQATLEGEVLVTLEEAASGSVRTLRLKRSQQCRACFGVGRVNQQSCRACEGRGRLDREESCKVNIPPGVRPGTVLRVPGMGSQIDLDGQAEDLFLKVRFASHPLFEREGDHLYCSLTLAPWEAALGCQLTIPTLSGRVSISVPAGAQHGGKLRIKGRGLPKPDGDAGDLVVELRLAVPTKLTPKERAGWEYLRDAATFRPRETEGTQDEPSA